MALNRTQTKDEIHPYTTDVEIDNAINNSSRDSKTAAELKSEGKVIDPISGATIQTKTKEERLFIARLDLILLVYCCVSQIVKGLDQQNIAAAYVSGMKEDLHITGDAYNYFTTFFNIGYAVFVIPSQIMLTWMRPSIWLPCLELGWGVLTFIFFTAKNVKEIYALRAFVGAMEASAYPGAITILSAWYSPRELALRIGFYHSSQWISAVHIQAAIYQGMDGVRGIPGWRWMFVIDGIITVVVAGFGFFLIPDFPSKPNPWSFWLKPKHHKMAQERSARFRRADNKKFNRYAILRAVKQPQFYQFPILYMTAQLAQQGYLYFNLFLKSLKNPDGTPVWSVAEVNALPMAGYAISIVMVWGWGWASDFFQNRWAIILAQAVLGLIPGIIMSVWNVPIGAKYFSYFLSFSFIATSPPLFAWLSDMTPHDSEMRAFVIGCCTATWYAVNSWANVLIWPAKEAPHWRVGWKLTVGMWLSVMFELWLIWLVDMKYVRPRNQKIGQEQYEQEVQYVQGTHDEPPVDNKQAVEDVAIVPVNSRR
uniref:Major facilitator superfamily (MFS) profile domain-containing protein n=1 Tax=Kwoniella dejecticola CBS 10117 TaxID=1296121 RepID=A0A1A5ZW60_9TREE|nr:uncharacterized protein I303_07959 [Kwoniella dejecticola CBS 10117]OBR82045.1 hypothetical protein I303_07959 [Kwoniella dejecticola CBS 10117]